jgi:DNA repair photolyase
MLMSVKYKEVACKSVLGNLGILNTRFWTKHCFDPYNNCEFNCVYCNTATSRHIGFRKFSAPVYAKVNAPRVLARELACLKRKGVVSIGLAMDPYQPAEKKYRITQQILEVLKEHNCPFAIGTKSDLALRDIDLISQASKKSRCCVSLSITTIDENLAKLFEPNAPSPKRRLEVVRKLSDAGITTGVWFSPIIPYVTDSDENIARVIEAAVENGARFVLGGALDMRNPVGFKRFLEEHFAWLVPSYDRLYKTRDGSYTYYPNESYLYYVYKRFVSLCQSCGVENYIPHFHTRKQAILFYLRNFSGFNGTSVSELIPLLNYLPPIQELLQTVQIRSGNLSLSKSFLKTFRYFPH